MFENLSPEPDSNLFRYKILKLLSIFSKLFSIDFEGITTDEESSGMQVDVNQIVNQSFERMVSIENEGNVQEEIVEEDEVVEEEEEVEEQEAIECKRPRTAVQERANAATNTDPVIVLNQGDLKAIIQQTVTETLSQMNGNLFLLIYNILAVYLL